MTTNTSDNKKYDSVPTGKTQYRRRAWLELSPTLLDCAKTAYESENKEAVFPPLRKVFRAFEYFNPEETKVVILGQDPYHKEGKASGLAFGYSHSYHGPLDSSLDNVLREAEYTDESLMQLSPADYLQTLSLEEWAKQGVLLLNTRLTVLEGQPLSHSGIGWETAVHTLLKRLDSLGGAKLVWLCWGAEARNMVGDINPAGHVISTSHPCRYSNIRGSQLAPAFSGSKCFSKCNELLQLQGQGKILW